MKIKQEWHTLQVMVLLAEKKNWSAPGSEAKCSFLEDWPLKWNLKERASQPGVWKDWKMGHTGLCALPLEHANEEEPRF